jgi:outer membrane protein assembly factor BamA
VVSALVLYDRRDNPMQPTKGIAVSAIAEWVPGVITLTDRPRTSFLKAEGNVSVHFPLGGLQFHLSAGGGVATPLFETTVVPLEDRFRLGGTGSMRGFKRDVIGPRNRTSRVNSNWPDGLAPIIDYTLRDSPERWAPTGGDAQFLGTFELNLPLPLLGMPAWEGYAIAFFADVGNVWLTGAAAKAGIEESEYSDAAPPVRVGAGLGVRAATAVGPLQIDLASNPQALFARGETRLLLREQYQEPPFWFHLTLGTLR